MPRRDDGKPESSRVYNRRSVLAALSSAGVVGLAGCSSSDGGGTGSGSNSSNGGGSGGGEVSITLPSVNETGTPMVNAGEKFKQKVESESDGAISVKVTPGGSYGSEPESIDLLSSGSIEMYTGGSAPYQRWANEYYFVNQPFVMESFDQLLTVMQSDEYQPAYDQIREDGNVRVMGEPRVYRGVRHYTSNNEVKKPGDVENMDLRLPEEDAWIQIWEEIGASPTPVALNELYSGLRTGVVEASEGPPAQISSLKLWEVQDYYNLTGHLVLGGSMYINDDFFRGLDETYQDMITQAANEATAEASEEAMKQEEKLMTRIKEEGMTIVDDVDQEAFAEAGRPAVEELFETTYAGTWDKWRNL
ncbi:C4-dicarboxylate ABC transporter substrate-binding protein [Halarchaeum grantii]|uniref:C4-dicarboxylate ABC transporter substrate-binding protein n=1 Tax=Halarchaeum grantii TaxID=1193105 RepID=A0A830F4W8_9EURY|nr:TRAP transporter substrate-binding protein [Halarchaeum grantii]GGL39064.1 C4-dicarboxylate ABC transporter substrate-binding protein [Halarchaeum grantii]